MYILQANWYFYLWLVYLNYQSRTDSRLVAANHLFLGGVQFNQSICLFTNATFFIHWVFSLKNVVKVYLFWLYMSKCFACMYACVPHMCLVSMEARWRCQTLWNWSYRWLCVTIWMLEPKTFSTKSACTLNHRTISTASWSILKSCLFKYVSFKKWIHFIMKSFQINKNIIDQN